MDRSTWNKTWSSMLKKKAMDVVHVPIDFASTPTKTPEFYLKLALQCLEQAERISSPPKFNNEQCKYLVDKLRLAIMSASSIITQMEMQFLSLASPEDKVQVFEIFKLLHSMGKEVEDFTQSCCGESWIQFAILLTSMSERVETIGFNLEFCTIIFTAIKLGKTTQWSPSNVSSVCQAEVDFVKEMATLDEMNLVMDLKVITQSNGSSSIDWQLALFLLEKLKMIRLMRSGVTLPTSNNKCHLQMNLNLKQTQGSLGKGASASVHKAKWFGVEVAKKTFHGPKNEDFLREVAILEGLCHPNIVSLLWSATDEKRCHLVMELMDGDLHTLLQERMEENGDQGPPFCIQEALDLILQVGEGMSFLHEKRIVHRDLKSQNILIKYGKAAQSNLKCLRVKVADFGLSKTKEQSAYSNMTLNVGTTRWMAPEVMEIVNDDDQARKLELKYPFKSDVYSFAMVCYEILTGDVPFSNLTLSEVKSLVLHGGRPQLPRECPDGLRALIEACWSTEAVTRPRFASICEDLRNLKYGTLLTYWIENIPECAGASRATIARLVANLSNSQRDMQQFATYGICLQARKSVGHRNCIAIEGAIPLLVTLLLSPDQGTQENSLSALLELSMDDCNKKEIISAGAIPPIVEVLRSGSVAAQDNAAEILFSLSLVDENRSIIGNSGAIRALVQLENSRFDPSKFHILYALFSLCICQPGNKARAVEAGLDVLFWGIIEADPAVLVQESVMGIFVDRSTPQIQNETESATSFLLAICSHDPGYLKQVKESNAMEALTALTRSRNFSDRGKWKASTLLELLKKPEVDVHALSHRVERLQM